MALDATEEARTGLPEQAGYTYHASPMGLLTHIVIEKVLPQA